MKKILFSTFLLLGFMACKESAEVTACAGGKCTGSSNCKACKNCTGCKHCYHNGGSCGVCR